MHLLRSAPCTGHPSLTDIDNSLRRCVSKVTNIDLSDDQWCQASLSVKAGGLGVRLATQIAPSAFLAASHSSAELQARILSLPTVAVSVYESAAQVAWT